MACTRFGEVCSCCSLNLLPGPAWVLLQCVLQTIFSGPVRVTAGEKIKSEYGFLTGWKGPYLTSFERYSFDSVTTGSSNAFILHEQMGCAGICPSHPTIFLPSTFGSCSIV